MSAADTENADDAETSGLALRFSVEARHAGARLDKSLAELLPDVSRSRLQRWVLEGAVRVNGAIVKPRHSLVYGDLIELEPQPAADAAAFVPEPMDLAVVYEDDSLLVIDKPPGLVVHPAAGHWSGTLLNGLLAHDATLAELPRAGIVHRLDADTSGLMVVARTLTAQTHLVRQLQSRSVTREYWALVRGEPAAGASIDAPIGRDPRNPLRFRVRHGAQAKPARTRYLRLQTVVADETRIAWLAVRLETGRTHQIRVHMESIGHPLIGDPVYRRGLPPRDADTRHWRGFPRQALHACRLGLHHPVTNRPLDWFRPPAPDMADLMAGLGFAPLDRPSREF
jgi:23S rRNA pseudouridine1911/1915/1917 synthase